jgi:hypothetical protein
MYRLIPLVALAGLLAVAPTASSRSSATSGLQLVQRQPLQVQGLRFRAHERVRVHAYATEETELRVRRASRGGRFLVDFGAFPSNPCLQVTVKAVGARGDHATLVIQPQPPPELPCRG